MTPSLDIHWKETPLELLRLCSDEQDPEVERRLHALWLLSVGRSVEEVADYEEVHPGTVQQWLAWYRHGGLAEVRRRRRGGRGRPALLTEEQQKILRDKLSTGTLRSAREVMDWVYEVFGVKYTRAGMKTLLQRMARPEGDSTGGQ